MAAPTDKVSGKKAETLLLAALDLLADCRASELSSDGGDARRLAHLRAALLDSVDWIITRALSVSDPRTDGHEADCAFRRHSSARTGVTTMDDSPRMDRPDRDALLALLVRVEELYQQGGPETPQGNGPYEPDALVGEVLAELVDPANDDPNVFAGFASSYGLTSAPALRALIRLTAAKAAEAAIRYALGEPGRGGPVTAETVLDEVATTQSWLRD